MRSKAWLAARVSLRQARLPRTASSAQRSRRLRSTHAAAPVLLAHAEVTKIILFFQWVQNLGTLRYADRAINTLVQSHAMCLYCSLVRQLAEKCAGSLMPTHTLDGIVPVCHSEGSGGPGPNNLLFLKTVLSGWASHPNVAAVLAVEGPRHDDGTLQAVTWTSVVERAHALGRGNTHHSSL